MSEHDVERRFKDLPIEEQRAFLASVGEPMRDYEPIQPRGTDWRAVARRIWAPIAALLGVAVKFGFLFLKFFALFVAVGGYALLWGWRFGVGVVLLILAHEMGHFVVARAQGLAPGLPMFIPFLGAYVRHAPQRDPLRAAFVSLGGPALGAVAAAACWALGAYYDSDLLRALGYFGFFLNLINLLPVGFLDGGHVMQSWRLARQQRSPAAVTIAVLYGALALLLVLGMWATHVPQHRL